MRLREAEGLLLVSSVVHPWQALVDDGEVEEDCEGEGGLVDKAC